MRLKVVLLFLVPLLDVVAQELTAPTSAWETIFGGSSSDVPQTIQSVADGFIIGASSYSTNGRSAPLYGFRDIWIIKTDACGKEQWNRSLGGSSVDSLAALSPAPDGSLLIGANSFSGPDGCKTMPNFGEEDFWLLKLTSSGGLIWDVSWGGEGQDQLHGVTATPDNGVIAVGQSNSGANGIKTSQAYGLEDGCVIAFDFRGQKIWEQSFGGTGVDQLFSILPLADGGMLVGGSTDSQPLEGTRSAPSFGSSDFWIIRLDPGGNILWEKTYGGPGFDRLVDMVPQANGYILAGYSESGAEGTKLSPNHGGLDFWVLKVDLNGTVVWDLSCGSQEADVLSDVESTPEGGLVLTGYSFGGPSGTKQSAFYGGGDHWVVRLDPDGQLLWEGSFGGTGDELGSHIAVTPTGAMAIAGYSTSPPGGNKTSSNLGDADCWIFQLNPERPWLSVNNSVNMEIEQEGFRGQLYPGEQNQKYILQASKDLKTWTSIQTNLVNTPVFNFSDSQARGQKQGFYRVIKISR